MKSYHITTLLLALFFALPTAWAQPPKGGEKNERIKAFRIAYMTEKLALTPEESKVFWPLFDEFQQKQKELRREERDLMHKDMAVLSDAEVEAMMNKRLDLREAGVKLEREYMAKMQKVISIRKIAMLHRVERQFREELLRIMQNRKDKGGGGMPPPHDH